MLVARPAGGGPGAEERCARDGRDWEFEAGEHHRTYRGCVSPLVDYDDHQHEVYAQGRELPASTVAERMAWVRRHIGTVAPWPVLDVGSGTGRFSAALASTLQTRVVGVEPSEGMRQRAAASRHPKVHYLGGTAERLPIRSGSVGAAVVMNVLHHAEDRAEAADELARVVRLDGPLLVTGSVRGNYERLLARWFPSIPALAAEVLPTPQQLEADLAAGGWRLDVFEALEQPLAEHLSRFADRIALRAVSLLELLPDEEFEEGVARLKAEAAVSPPSPVIDHYECFVFRR